MISLIFRFGKLPDDVRSKWAQADRFLDKDGNLLNEDDYEPYNADDQGHGDIWQVGYPLSSHVTPVTAASGVN